MDGNFRILQTAENEFRIQKEIIIKQNKPVYVFEIPVWIKTVDVRVWQNVDKYGIVISMFNVLRPDPAIYADIDSAIRRINYIKEYPKVVYSYENKIQGHRNPPPPPPPQVSRLKESGIDINQKQEMKIFEIKCSGKTFTNTHIGFVYGCEETVREYYQKINSRKKDSQFHVYSYDAKLITIEDVNKLN